KRRGRGGRNTSRRRTQRARRTLVASQPNRNTAFSEKFLHVTDGIFTEMENARGENGVGFAEFQHVREMLEFARATARDDWNPNRFAHAPRDFDIKTGFRAVSVDAV